MSEMIRTASWLLVVGAVVSVLCVLTDYAWQKWSSRPFYVKANLSRGVSGEENARRLQDAMDTPSPSPRRPVVVILPPGTFEVTGSPSIPNGITLRGARR